MSEPTNQKTIESNSLLFLDCLSTPLISKTQNLDTSTGRIERRVAKNRRGRETAIKPVLSQEEDDAGELAGFIDYLATEIFGSLPEELRRLTYSTWLNTPSLQTTYTLPLPSTTITLLLNTMPVSLGNVACLCRACHSFVHQIASNEELARDWYTVEKLGEREDVMAFTKWVGRVRWKGR
ncbi:hypothetical protein BJ875DRAFT_502440 [Amylocarpus encephaloides]|uniref:Uncharacterized protein n=1 Tax=Amylocarpus encephaloides TaxID=45428 RepID=A0A9P7YQ25_9HELO|nr:hypothetical protein BJ875DRAFT_502440 [Amylocarpus encephaloides]